MAQNWYPFYVGDYARKTAHLSMLEHGAYRLLLDHYYATGEPLPDDNTKLFRICRARTPSERQSVLSTVAEFFTKDGTLLRSKKCDRELNKQLNYSNSQSAKAKLRHSHGNAVDVPHARNTTTTTTTKESTVLSSNDFSKVYDYGSSIFPKLATSATHEITKWLEAGCSIEKDILPCIDRAKGKNIGAWVYFSGAIMDSKASREKPLPEGRASASNFKPMTTTEIDRQARKGAKTIL